VLPSADNEAFERLFRAHHPAVRAYARRRIDPTTAEDIVAETFVVCWRRLADVPEDPLPWLLGVARRCLANRRRADDRRSALAERAEAWLPAGSERDIAEAVTEREELLSAFGRLSATDREVLALVAWDGLDVAGAARVLGCSTTALKVRLHRARRRLRRQLGDAESTVRPTTARELAR
jgi:RNA polymerase sigma-70 factor (ECF subfamily)